MKSTLTVIFLASMFSIAAAQTNPAKPETKEPAKGESKDKPAAPIAKNETPPSEKKTAPTAEDTKAWEDASKPGENHKKLDFLVGTWTIELSGFDPSAQPSKGESEFKWIHGGRFLQESTKTNMFGQPFEWTGWLGYDMVEKKYVGAWIDTFQTRIEHFEGKWDEATKTVIYLGDGKDPATGEVAKVKWAIQNVSPDKAVTTMSAIDADGVETQVMKLTATRVK